MLRFFMCSLLFLTVQLISDQSLSLVQLRYGIIIVVIYVLDFSHEESFVLVVICKMGFTCNQAVYLSNLKFHILIDFNVLIVFKCIDNLG